jgi:hypothetical protein
VLTRVRWALATSDQVVDRRNPHFCGQGGKDLVRQQDLVPPRPLSVQLDIRGGTPAFESSSSALRMLFPAVGVGRRARPRPFRVYRCYLALGAERPPYRRRGTRGDPFPANVLRGAQGRASSFGDSYRSISRWGLRNYNQRVSGELAQTRYLIELRRCQITRQ